MLLELNNIKKSYISNRFEVSVLNGVDLAINENDYVSLMGASGSGKSTLLHILGLLDTPSSGDYFFGSTNVASLNHYQLAEIRNINIGFVFQSFNLLPKCNALKNVEMPLMYQKVKRNRRSERAIIALDRVGLKDRIYHNSNELSGGEQQRVAIARALINNPKLILADEPTGNLDSNTGAEIMSLFNELHKEGHTIVLITHDNNVANFAKKQIVLKDGRVV